MGRHSPFTLFVCALVLSTLCPSTSWAQQAPSPATLSGIVRDSSGAPVANARVALKDQKGTVVEASADATGRYVLANMPPGSYQVDVTWPDGRLGASRTVTLRADSITVDLTLDVGSFAETVTVAAKREEPLAQTPATIDVLPGSALTASGTTDVMQIDAYVPNMHLTNSGGRASINYLSMRGFINTESAIDPSIAMYVDGVPVTDFYSTSQSLANVEQVEVLKGPQGTLYGVNSQAGVINIRSPRPTNEWHGGLGANIGTFGTFNPTGSVAGPLVKDRLFLGVSGSVDHRDGFIRNVVSGKHYDTQSGGDGRARLIWTPSAQWEFSFAGSYRTIDDGGGFIYLPTDLALFNQLPGLSGYHVGPFEQALDYEGANTSHATAISGQATYHGAHAEVVYTSAWRRNRQAYSFDIDLTPVPSFAERTTFDVDNRYNELRVQSPGGSTGRVTWTTGVTVQQEDRVGDSTIIAGSANPFGLPPADYAVGTYDLNRHFLGAYGQATVRTSGGRVGLTGGLRYDRVTGQLDREASFFAGYPEQHEPFSDDIWLPKVGVDVRLSDQNLLYVSAGRGWKSGGLSPYASTLEQSRFGRESSWTYEAGFRSTVPDHHATFNAAVFLNRIAGFQDAIQNGIYRYLGNAEQATSYGVDLSGAIAVTRALSLNAGIGATQFHYDQYLIDAGNGVRFDGKAVPQVPSYNGWIRAAYQFSNGVYARAESILTGSFVDRFYVPPPPGAAPVVQETQMPSAQIYNLAAGWTRDRWTIGVLAQNVADRLYFVNSEDGFGAYSGYTKPMGVIGARRLVSLQLSTHF